MEVTYYRQETFSKYTTNNNPSVKPDGTPHLTTLGNQQYIPINTNCSKDKLNTLSKGGIKMSVSKTRGFLYKLARLLGDFSAVSSGSPKKMTKRVGRRVAGRAAGKGLRKLFK